MKVRVNGEEKDIKEGTTLEGLLMGLGIKTIGIAVEINSVIVPKKQHGVTALREGDAVEIVRMVGGG